MGYMYIFKMSHKLIELQLHQPLVQSTSLLPSNTTRTTFAFDACLEWKLAPLAEERNGISHRISIATIDLVLIDQQSVGKRSHHLMDTVNAKMRWTRIKWRVNNF
jgi:hypothetical protein